VTLQQALVTGRNRLIAAGIAPDEAAIDVDVYARTILGWDRARLLTEHTSPAPPGLEPAFSEWVERRTHHEPTAYIVGVREFWGLEFRVSAAVLIPRPETEFIVEESLALLEPLAGPRIADIGTGSGNIAISLAHSRADLRVVATDVSADALAVAMENAERHAVADRVQFVVASYLGGVEGDFDLIAANPPYVRDRDRPGLGRPVRHEPEVALFGGDTGLRDIEGVLDTAIAKLRPRGWLVMEFGFGQEVEVRNLVNARQRLEFSRFREDLQGLARTAIIRRRSALRRTPHCTPEGGQHSAVASGFSRTSEIAHGQLPVLQDHRW
jgi:release factor glutamine methyltransferase